MSYDPTIYMQTYLLLSLDVRRVVRDSLCNAEVDELQGSLHKDKVRGFEVGMDDLFFMNDLNGLQHL